MIEVHRRTLEDAQQKLRQVGLDPKLFLVLLDSVNAALAANTLAIVRVYVDGEPQHQCSATHVIDGRRFKMVWEVDWNHARECYVLIEFSPIEISRLPTTPKTGPESLPHKDDR